MNTAIYLAIKIIPNAQNNEIVGWEEGILKIRINAQPEKGKANDSLIAFLAETLNIRKNQVRIVFGKTNRNKSVTIEGLPKEEIMARLNSPQH